MSRRKRNSESMYQKQYYNYGSEAYKYYPEVEYGRRKKRNSRVERKRTERKDYEKKLKNKTKIVRKQKTHYEFVKGRTANFKVYFSIGTLFTFFAIFICMFAINNRKEAEINSNLMELKKLEESNAYLQTEMTKNIKLEEVEKIAKTKLNMQKPAPHQIVYINIPKQSYTVQYNLPQETDEESGFLKIWNNLFGD